LFRREPPNELRIVGAFPKRLAPPLRGGVARDGDEEEGSGCDPNANLFLDYLNFVTISIKLMFKAGNKFLDTLGKRDFRHSTKSSPKRAHRREEVT
jgi:hypothetical protein